MLVLGTYIKELLISFSRAHRINRSKTYSRFHLVLCITLKDSELVNLADQMPDTVEDVYQKAVSGQLLMEQQNTLNKLQQSGVLILDTTPENLSVAAVNRYLELKGKNLI